MSAAEAKKTETKKGAAKPAQKSAKPEGKAADAPAAASGKSGKSDAPAYTPRAKPVLDDEMRQALGLRADSDERRPAFRRQEWWRYRKLGGKDAPWRRPRGIHSKMRRHYKYRPPVASIGYRGPALARGLHPSGFEEVLVHRPEDLAPLDKERQAARIGRTVGGRKAELIQKEADTRGIRVLNRRD